MAAKKKSSANNDWYSRLDEAWKKVFADEAKRKQASITDVYIDDESEVTSLEPLAAFEKIREINCDGKQITDLSPLAKLPKLESLRITSPIADFSPLAKMTGLKSLELSDTTISDLAPIAKLVKLERLELNETQVSDLSPIAGLKKIERLEIGRTKVRDLSPIAGWKKLNDLEIDSCPIESFDVLAKIPDLHSLDASKTSIASLAPIDEQNGIHILHVRETKITFEELLRYRQKRGVRQDSMLGLSLYSDFNEHDAFFAALEKLQSFAGVEPMLTGWINDVLIMLIRDEDEAHRAPKLLERWFALDVPPNEFTKEIAGNALHVIVTQNVDPSLEKRVLEKLVPQAEMDRRLAFNLSCYHAKRGNKADVLRYARIALEKGQESASFKKDKDFESLQDDAEFLALIATNFTPDPYTSPMAWWNGLPEDLKECIYWDEESGEDGLKEMLAEPLDLQVDGVRSIDPLRNLRVSRFIAREAKVSSLEIVATFRGLEEIIWERNEYMGGTQLTDISPLATVTSLRSINMPGHLFTNLDGVAKLVDLEDLNVRESPLESIEGVRDLVKLTDLAIDPAKPVDLSALENLEKLEDLWIHGPVLSLEPIAKLKSLRRFWMQKCTLADGTPVPFEPLFGLKKLEQIWVGSEREAEAKKTLKKALPKCKVG